MTKSKAVISTILVAASICTLVALIYPKIVSVSLPSAPSVTPGYYAVTHVVDGDTIDVSMNNQTERVRLIGVDTPETKKPNTPVQCFGPQASDYTKQQLTGKSVRLEADPKSDNRDKYGRLLRYVYLPDGTLLDEDLIKKGYAFAYVLFDFTKKAEFSANEQAAQIAGIGLWAACQPTKHGEKWESNALR